MSRKKRFFFLMILSILTVEVWSNSSAELFRAIDECDITKIRALIASGFDVNARNEDDMTPLMCTCRAKCPIEVVELLVKNGADINAQESQFGMTALIFAVGNIDKVKYLVSKGADINLMEKATEVSGFNAVIRAAIYALVSNDLRPLRFLLDNGGDINITTADGRSLLMVIVEMASAEKDGYRVVKYLLKRGAKVNLKSKQGDTSLLIAIDYGNIHLAKLLLKHGADPNCMNKSRQTPLSIVKARKNEALVKLLLKYGAKDESSLGQ